MTNLAHGPKIRCLTSSESIATLEAWKNNVLYGLKQNPDFRVYLHDGYVWGKKTRAQPFRCLEDVFVKERFQPEDESKPPQDRLILSKTREDRAAEVDLLLDQVANYCPNIPRQDITKDSRSIEEVWQTIRRYYNKQQSGSLLNDAWSIRRELEETPQSLYSRMKQIYCDNLLTTNGLIHVDGVVHEDEELSPTLLNTIILHWLQVLHPDLRDLVTQRFVTQLRDHTYGAIFPEISRSVDAFLEELNNGTSVNRAYNNRPYSYQSFNQRPQSQFPPTYRKPFPRYNNPQQFNNNHRFSNPQQFTRKQCDFCRVTGKVKYRTHSIDECMFIKRLNNEKTGFVKHLECQQPVESIEEHYEEFFDCVENEESTSGAYQVSLPNKDIINDAYQVEHVLNLVNIDASPILELQANNNTYNLTLDTGATCNLIKESVAKSLKAVIKPTSQRVRLADGQTTLDVVGEINGTLFRNNKPYKLTAIVCRNTDTDILAGMPFLKQNDIAIRPYSDEIILGGTEFIKYNPNRTSFRAIKRITLQSEINQVILPGEAAVFKVNASVGDVAIEPRLDSSHNKRQNKHSSLWPKPEVAIVKDGLISLTNTHHDPVMIRKHDPICNIYPGVEIPEDIRDSPVSVTESHEPVASKTSPKIRPYSDAVNLNPDNLLNEKEVADFKEILTTYDSVFSPVDSTYNGRSGACYVEVNVGKNPPPQWNGRTPFYSDTGLDELQAKFDEMKAKGMFSRPQDIGVTVENVNNSFLVKKTVGKRLVTDHKAIASYCRPTPSLLPDVETTLRRIMAYKDIIKSDMSESYNQIKVKRESKKYLGVHTPYKGLLVYNVGAMGLPGVEVALEELTCLIVGDLVQQGKVCKLADDFIIGGDGVQELKQTFQVVLQRFLENNIKLNPSKTTIVPKSVAVLGWVWTSGKLKASPHKMSSLASCPPPKTVTALKSYLGAYRFISRIIKGYASLLAPLEQAIKGKEPKDQIQWSDQLLESFQKSKDALSDAKTITIPKKTDMISIVTDASIRPGAVGATMYTIRDNKPLIGGYFNCKLPEFQQRWLPCEAEGLAIALALNHFSPYIIQSEHKPQVLTDSKACCDAVKKLIRGEFSASARLSTFLSSVSRYNADVVHIPGKMNLVSDHASRHPLKCEDPGNCAVCKFAAETMNSVVNAVSVEEVLEGKTSLPWINRRAWGEVQEQCSTLRKVKFFKRKGSTPRKKSKNLRKVRQYISAGTIVAHDNILINPMVTPLGPVRERIVVPEQVLHGLVTIMHLRLSHPTAYQLSKVFSRYFFALDSEKTIKEVCKACSQCAAIRDVPTAMVQESTDPPPHTIGGRFAADIIKRNQQKIFCIRETVTSYTLADLIPSETRSSVSDALVKLCNILKPSKEANITVRLDPAPAHQSLFNALQNDQQLLRNNIKLEIGRILNKNKNPVIDKGIRELVREVLILQPSGGQISSKMLSEAVANLNCRYRRSGMSSQEMWTMRDQITGEQLPISDLNLITEQYQSRIANHPHSQKSKSKGKPSNPKANVAVGSLVFLYADRNKVTARERYLVTAINGDDVKIRKFCKKLFGLKEYDTKLSEMYCVPSLEDSGLPRRECDDSSSDDDIPYLQTLPDQAKSNKPKDPAVSDTDDTSESDDEISVSSEYNTPSDTSVFEDQEERDDPTFPEPRNLIPSTMERGKRKRKKPDRYGHWSQ